MYILNNKQSADTWVGQTIQPGAYYNIEATKKVVWGHNDKVVQDLSNGNLILSYTNDNTSHVTSPSLAISALRGENPTDSDGSPLMRTKVAPSGWHYQLHGLELTTSKVNGYYDANDAGVGYGYATVKHYDSNGTLLTTQQDIDASCVKTVLDWEPTWDYEMIGGSVFQTSSPTNNFRFWITAVPDIPSNMGGSVPFGTSINLKYVDKTGNVSMDGRSPKRLTYSATYHTNKLRITHTHDAGLQHTILYMFELFKST